MSAAEDAARLGLGKSVHDNREQMSMTEESRVLLTALVRNEMRAAVADGIVDALTDDNAERFWRKGLQVLQEQATKQAGILLWGGIKRVLGVGAIVLLVWLVAGGQAAKVVLGAFARP